MRSRRCWRTMVSETVSESERTAMTDRPPSTDAPLTCIIRSGGELTPGWSDRLGGLRLRVRRTKGYPITKLSGRLPDQAAIMGVLVSLYNLGLPLISVSCRIERGRSWDCAGLTDG
jgi:hypothetical protein